MKRKINMKKLILTIYALLFVAASLNAQQTDFPKLTGPYLGQKPPGMTPKIFAQGIISKRGSDEWGCTVNREWTEIFFSRTKDNKASVFHLERTSYSWSTPDIAAFSGQYNDSHPVFSSDGTKVFFGSKRPCPGAKQELNLWLSEKINGAWMIPKSMGKPFVNQVVHAASVSPEGDVYTSGLVMFGKKDTGYNGPRKLDPNITGMHPAVSPDGSYLVFTARRSDGFGGTDLYVIYKNGINHWTGPAHLGRNVNTKDVESSPSISLDGRFLFFSRNGDIYWVDAKIIEEMRPK